MSDRDDDHHHHRGEFDYNSSQNYFDIEYQIDLLELRQFHKQGKLWKEKRRRSFHHLSTRQLQSNAVLLKICRKQCKQEQIHCQCFSSISNTFECDEELSIKPTHTKSAKQSVYRKKNKFSYFRYRFYQKHHEKIKASLNNNCGITIDNIRLAPTNKSIQNQFMEGLSQKGRSVPQLVYHGTSVKNFESILRHGFLVPNQPHPTNKHAPIIQASNGQAYDQGIYCSRRASYSLGYARGTNTLLVCAAIPKCNEKRKIQYFGDILVLPHVSQIIPLFLMDCSYLSRQKCDCYRHRPYTPFQTTFILERFLQRILSYVNDRIRRNEQYQMRLFDQFN